MRIDKFLSDMGVATRKEAKDSAKRGGVQIDGVAVRDVSAHIDPERVTVSYLGRVVEYKPYVYVMLNKPEGYVSATEDSRLPVVTELLPEELRRRSLFPVGRLDRDTTGLMILTDNGKLAHALLSPRGHVRKVYSFSAAEPLRAGVEEEFRDGVVLADGYECKSAKITLDEVRTSGFITLTEGKYHQIKRMVASTGNKVTRLERVSFGEVTLDASLERGEWRYLTDSEIKTLTDALGV
ncbi:MAG: rRNA pseudouridine synthase [Clostridia bacterium]|nr:rRNA pseudouridine synthase [Clostridia bacterium]